MAPPEHPFPVSELENAVHTYSKNFHEKNRKLGKDFNLKDCELYELVQWSCTTQLQQSENMRKSGGVASQMECFPFVRLFRKCGEGNKTFHVETTAWEGEHAWTHKPAPIEQEPQTDLRDMFTKTAGFLWSKR